MRTVCRLIDEGELRRTKIRGPLRIPVLEIEKHEKELKKEMADPQRLLRFENMSDLVNPSYETPQFLNHTLTLV